MLDMFIKLWNENPSTAALFTVGFSGLITGVLYSIRGHLSNVLHWASTQVFTTVTLCSDNVYFYYFLDYLKRKNKLQHLRNVKIISTVDVSRDNWPTDYNDNVKLSFTNCSSLIKLKNTIYFIRFTSHQLENSNIEITNMHIKYIGRSFKRFNSLMKEIMISIMDEKFESKSAIVKAHESPMNYLYANKFISVVDPFSRQDRFYGEGFNSTGVMVPKRSFDNVFLQNSIKNRLIQRIDQFIADYHFYKSKNLNYHLGLMLYGEPGCGKTSLIKAIASKYNFEITKIPASKLDMLPEILASLSMPNENRFKRLFTKNLEEHYAEQCDLDSKYSLENFNEEHANIRDSSENEGRFQRGRLSSNRLLWAAPKDLTEVPKDVLDKVFDRTMEDFRTYDKSITRDIATNRSISPIKFIVIEDIDTSAIVKKRDTTAENSDDVNPSAALEVMAKELGEMDENPNPNKKKGKKGRGKEKDKDKDWYSKFKESELSDILNCLDGVATPDFFIIIATTNKIDSIDDAILRPGRFDMCVNIPAVDKEVFNQFLTYYFEDEHKASNLKDEDYELIPHVSVAKLQEEMLAKKTYTDIINTYTVKK